jgi:hypothetical protein
MQEQHQQVQEAAETEINQSQKTIVIKIKDIWSQTLTTLGLFSEA